MKKNIILLLAGITFFGAGHVLAQGNSDNASVGTKELLARVEALEAAIETLGGSSPDVSGRTYHTFTHSTGLGSPTSAQTPGVGHFSTLVSITRNLVFNPDGTGQWTPVACLANQLSVFANSPPFIEPARSGVCGAIAANSGINWVQVGNQVEITFNNTGATVILSVSSDGNVIATAPGVDASNNIRQFVFGSITIGTSID